MRRTNMPTIKDIVRRPVHTREVDCIDAGVLTD
jgi:hypothetical protein